MLQSRKKSILTPRWVSKSAIYTTRCPHPLNSLSQHSEELYKLFKVKDIVFSNYIKDTTNIN